MADDNSTRRKTKDELLKELRDTLDLKKLMLTPFPLDLNDQIKRAHTQIEHERSGKMTRVIAELDKSKFNTWKPALTNRPYIPDLTPLTLQGVARDTSSDSPFANNDPRSGAQILKDLQNIMNAVEAIKDHRSRYVPLPPQNQEDCRKMSSSYSSNYSDHKDKPIPENEKMSPIKPVKRTYKDYLNEFQRVELERELPPQWSVRESLELLRPLLNAGISDLTQAALKPGPNARTKGEHPLRYMLLQVTDCILRQAFPDEALKYLSDFLDHLNTEDRARLLFCFNEAAFELNYILTKLPQNQVWYNMETPQLMDHVCGLTVGILQPRQKKAEDHPYIHINHYDALNAERNFLHSSRELLEFVINDDIKSEVALIRERDGEAFLRMPEFIMSDAASHNPNTVSSAHMINKGNSKNSDYKFSDVPLLNHVMNCDLKSFWSMIMFSMTIRSDDNRHSVRITPSVGIASNLTMHKSRRRRHHIAAALKRLTLPTYARPELPTDLSWSSWSHEDYTSTRLGIQRT